MHRFIIFITNIIIVFSVQAAALEKHLLVSEGEIQVNPKTVLHLPGIGLGIRCDSDSIMLLDDCDLMKLGFVEPNEARSFVKVRSGIYAAEGDSIYRMSTDKSTHTFIGRLDNEQFTLHRATDSTFYANTADEKFSCVYEIFPETKECEPVISVEGPILKIQSNGLNTVIWVDDTMMKLGKDNKLVPVFQADNIMDMAVSPIGVLAGTTDGLYWLTGPNTGAKIVEEPIQAIWWDDSDKLYYLTQKGDLIVIIGLKSRFEEIIKSAS